MKWVLLGVSFVAGFITAVLLLGIYHIEGVQTRGAPASYKINRLTGETQFCVAAECRPVKDRRSQ